MLGNEFLHVQTFDTIEFGITTVYLASAQYRPKYAAFVGGQSSGEIAAAVFKAQEGVGAQFFVSGDHWEHMIVDSFQVSVFRNKTLSFTYHNVGGKFDPELQVGIRTLKKGDTVLIYDLWGTTADKLKVFLEPLEFILK